jgi:hypothetical protein
MKPHSAFKNFFSIFILACLGGIVGFTFGNMLFSFFIPPWSRFPIKSPPEKASRIISLEIKSDRSNPENDSIFIVTDAGKLLSYKLFLEDWQEIKIGPTPEAWIVKCARPWPNRPLVLMKVVSSLGVAFDHALLRAEKCYVLFENGSLEVWTRETDVFIAIYVVGIGTIIGFIVGLWGGNRFIKRKNNKHLEK